MPYRFLAGAFFAAVFTVVVLRAGAAAFVAVFFGRAALGVVFFGVVAVAVAVFAAVAFFVGAAALATFGTLPAATMSLKLAPARNAGTEVFLTLTASPVRGLRSVRAARTRFSKTPKPVMATLSPLVTADWISASTASSAAVADFLSPSRPASASMSSALFTVSLPYIAV